jgi:uroporphyrinogen III methyltransferase / synthase
MGRVYLVGAGPGDPGLVTVRAARLLRRADVVVHDALVSAEVLALASPAAELIDVGKRCGGRHTPQECIHETLIEAAGRARIVVRLKGGDPFVFGRGGEEALALREAGIRFEIVPGVTAALGAAAYAGIPLTHRGVSSAVSLVTGHGCSPTGEVDADWERMARSQETLAVYMGVGRLREAADRLIRLGRSPLTPAAVIEKGTYAEQRVVEAPLFQIADAAEREAIGSPALVVIGEVVALRARIDWFACRPLHGLRVLVPRSRSQPSRLARTLRARGAEVVEYPKLQLLPPARPEALRDAADNVWRYDWVLFTSPTAVERFWAEVVGRGRDVRHLAAVRFACFGAATITALARRGIRAEVAEPTFVAAAAVDALAAVAPLDGARVLFPRDAGGVSHLATRLASAGARVDEVEAYREALVREGAQSVRRDLDSGEIDAVTFASSLTVQRFVEALGADVGRAAVAAIGPDTVATARAAGLCVDVVPDDATLEGLVKALRYLRAARAGRARDARPEAVALAADGGTGGERLRGGVAPSEEPR